MSYTATIVQLPAPRVHPNADRLQLFTIFGYQIITSLDHKEGEVGIFFPPDGQVSEEYAEANDLVGYKDEEGNRKGGFMDEKRRVKAINLRGEKSQGLWMPLSSLNFLSKDIDLNVGDDLDTFKGHQFCQKYITRATRQAKVKGLKVSRKETPTFKRHLDTKHLQRSFEYILPGSHVVFTEKVHGTSGRFGRALETFDRKWYDPKYWLMGKSYDQWCYLSGTRNVIHRTEQDVRQGYYDDNSFRMRVIEPLRNNLHKGETVYFEIVGWMDGQTPIMPSVNTRVLKDKSYVDRYGEEMYYKYGCPPGQQKMLVYRITMSNEDGITFDLTWPQVLRRCEILGVESVHEYGRGYVDLRLGNLFGIPRNEEMPDLEDYVDMVQHHLLDVAAHLSLGDSFYDHSHMREGVVLRIDNSHMTPSFYKYKSHEFLVLESHYKGREDYIDQEEIS